MSKNNKKLHSKNTTRQTIKIWQRVLWPFRASIAFAMLTKLIANLLTNILVPIEIGRIINRLVNSKVDDISYLYGSIGFIVLLLGLSIFLEYIWNRITAHYLVRARSKLEIDTFNSLVDKSWGFHSETFSGAVVSQYNRFISSFQFFHDTLFKDLYSIAINYMITIAVILVIAPRVGIVIFAWTVIYVGVVSGFSRKRFHNKQISAQYHSKLTGQLADVLANILTIKIFAREKYESSIFRRKIQSKMHATEHSWNWGAISSVIISSLMALLNVGVLLITVQAVSTGALTIGTLVLIQVFTVRLSTQLWQLGGILRDFDRSFAESGEMTEIITYAPRFSDVKATRNISLDKGAIELKNVYFEYPDKNSIPKFFNNLSLSIRPGEKVGIVGPSGSGKSTVIKLILRLAEPTKGEISIDGHNIDKIPRNQLRGSIAYVPQEPVLFHRTIIDNIKYAKPDASQEEIKRAAKKARANIFIDRLPKGYETPVGDRGVKLSTGQKQRIAIARAMLKSSPILILDEATSAIDSDSERLIQKSVDEIIKNRTTLIIAHRFSTIKKMDRIIFMSYGRIIEQGSHEELIKKDGAYAKLWQQQSGEFIQPTDF